MNQRIFFTKICRTLLSNYLSRKTTTFLILSVIMYLASAPAAFSQNALVPFNFNLSTASKTSAGVFKRDGTLVRTLWNNVSYPAGTHQGNWDRKDDEGRLLSDTGYIVKVISNNVNYKWEGVIGNTSDSFVGSTVIRMFDRMHGMTIVGNTAYYGAGYTEGITSSYKFKTDDPQKKYNLLYSEVQQMYQASEFVASDSVYVYWAGYDPFDASKSFVYATKVSDDKEVMFTSGSSVNITFGRTYPKVIDLVTGNINAICKGLAVQKNGNYLFVSRPGINELHVLDKKSGALVQNISMTSPRDLAIDSDDNLWIISGTNTVAKYSVNSNGTLSSALITISSLADPKAMAVSPDNKLLVVVDGGGSQQLKAFTNDSGYAAWTFGQYGGYESDPAVSDDKFYFSDYVTMLSKPFIAFQPDGSFWVADVGNERIQHYDSSRNFIERIMCLPHSYSVVADRNDPTRVFNEYLEFQVDYSKPLAPNNGSWKLIRNWRRGITKNYFMEGKVNIFNNVITLSNGRTYATLENCKVPDVRYPEVVELPATGHVRYTGVRFGDFSKDMIATDGSLRRFVSSGKVGDGGYWETQPLTGFSSDNNPVWGTSSKIGTLPTITEKDPGNGQVSHPAMTSSDILVVFERERYNKGFHLGGIRKHDNKYLWKACPATTRDYSGAFPADGAFDIGNNVEYAGGHVYSVDRNILWNYHGEFWKNGQTNMWNHFYDNGLMVGQFGVASYDAQKIDMEAFYGGAGNVFASTLVKYGSDYYIYHNDESVHAGVHRWKISGLNTIAEQSISLNFNPALSGGLTACYFDGADLNNIVFRNAEVNSTVNMSTAPSHVPDKNNYSVRWSGFVKPAYSQTYTFYTTANKGIRLWIDGNLVINQWGNSSQTEYSTAGIKMEAGKLYTVKMEINGGTIASLSWSSQSQGKQIIPSSALYPSNSPDYSTRIDLMEGLHYKSVLSNGLYGWSRNAVNEDSSSWQQYWRVRTGVKSYCKDKPDLFMTFRRDNSQYYVTRDMGTARQCMNSWNISGSLSYDANYAKFNDDNGGGYFDILDDQGKVISRIIHEQYLKNGQMYINIKCNGKTVVNLVDKYTYAVTNKPQPFELNITGTGIEFKYAAYAPITVGFQDATCRWDKPKTIKFNFVGSQSNYDRMINIHSLFYTIDASPVPVVTPSGPTQFCQGNSVTLTAGSASSYSWNTSETTQSITISSSGSYSVTVKDANGCPLTSKTTVVVVNPLPVPVITVPKTFGYCTGDSVKLSTGTANTYLWSNNANTSSIYVSKTGSYSVTVTDANGCTGSSSPVTIVENPLPTASASADGPTKFCQGKSVALTANPASAYLWSNNETTQTIQATVSGNYTVKVTDANGCTSVPSAPVTVTVDPVPVPTVTVGGPTTFCKGNDVLLTSSPAKSYLWSNNDTTQSIIVNNGGNYYVTAYDENGCGAPSSPVAITVNPLPTPTISVANDTLLTSSSQTGNQWFVDGKIIAGATSKYHIAKVDGKYTVEVTENGCTGTSPAVTVSTVGLDQLKDMNFVIYPNPGNGRFRFDGQELDGALVSIHNLHGQEIYRDLYSGSEIDLSSHAPGLYTVTVTIDGQSSNHKLIIQ